MSDLIALSGGPGAVLGPITGDRRLSARPRVYLHQFNQSYDNTIYLPVSIGMVKAYGDQDPYVAQHFEFGDLQFVRRDVGEIVTGHEDPEIMGFSIYVWNTALSMRVAKLSKERFGSINVFGGPSVPTDSEAWLREHPYVDYAVHGEGEQTFTELLRALRENTDLLAIPGLSFLKDGKHHHTGPRKRTRDLDVFPSPFLVGTFKETLEKPYSFEAVWETNRGCPFQCTFCYWGGNLQAKVALFSMERLRKELNWMADNEIEFIYAADANFGILERDLEIADMVVDIAKTRKYPNAFFINYSKNTPDRVFAVAKKFHDAGINKGTSLSLQSLDDKTLVNIKRKNIKLTVFRELQKQYKAAGIPSYTEFILPLPGETLETFIDGLDTTFESGEHDQVYVHLSRLLPNTEMSEPQARAKFEFVSRMIPIISVHASVGQQLVGEQEYEEILYATKDMPYDDWREAASVSSVMLVHLCMKVSYFLALFLRERHGIRYMDYCRALLAATRTSPDRFPILAREHARLGRYLDALVTGQGEVDYEGLEDVPEIKWPVDEIAFLMYTRRRTGVYAELRTIVDELLRSAGKSEDAQLLDELFAYQQRRLIDVSLATPEAIYSWNFPAYFASIIRQEPPTLERRTTRSVLTEKEPFANLAEFAKRQVWYGRRGKKFYYAEAWSSADAPEASGGAASPQTLRAS